MKMNCGIYQIKNLLPNEETRICKVYIGSTSNFKVRKFHHFNKLRKNKHTNAHLQSIYNIIKNKYGEENAQNYFEWSIIKQVEKYEDNKKLKEELEKLEQFYLDNYKIENKNEIDHDRCYNMSPTAGSTVGFSPTEETRKKISETLKRKGILPPNTKGRTSPRKGKKLLEETKKKISESKKGQVQSAESNNKRRESLLGRKRPKHVVEKMRRKVINLDTLEIFNSITEAAEYCNLKSTSGILGVCKGYYQTAAGYRWSYYKEKD